MFALTPIVDNLFEYPFDWVLKSEEEFINLDGAISDNGCASFLALLALYNNLTDKGSPEKAAQAVLNAKRLILPGGLLAWDETSRIVPGCCCGLEAWRDWYSIKPKGNGPWLGHDPSPWVDCRKEHAIIWSDTDPEQNLQKIQVSYCELETALQKTQDDFTAFADKFSDWAGNHTSVATEVTHRIAREFEIFPPQ